MVATSWMAVGLTEIVFLAVSLTLPLGTMPQPLDPALSAMAPAECLAYFSWAGARPADGASGNRCEQLLAEPQVAAFQAQLTEALRRGLTRAAGIAEPARGETDAVSSLVEAAWNCPWALAWEELRAGVQGPLIEAAWVIRAGDQRPALEAALGGLLESVGITATASESLGGVAWQRLPLSPEAPPVRIGWQGEYLLLAIGTSTAEQLPQRLRGTAPDWLTRVRQRHVVERESALAYVNLASLWDRVRPLLPPDGPSARWIAVMRLEQLRAIHARSGFDAVGSVSMTHLAFDEEPAGLWACLPREPLSRDDLADVPVDALAAGAVRFDLSAAWETLEEAAKEFDPRLTRELDRALWDFENAVGVNLRNDLVATLDDVWWKYVPAGELLTSWTGAAAGVHVKDPATLQRTLERLALFARAQMPGANQGQIAIRETQAGDSVIYSLEIMGGPLAPAWCLCNDQLVVGLLPHTVRAIVQREEQPSLADVEIVREAWDPADGPAALFYQDTPAIARGAYPIMRMGVQLMSAPLRMLGIDFDATLLPEVSTLARHLQPSVTTLRYEPDGFHLVTRSSVPSVAHSAAVGPLAIGVILPAVGTARTSALNAQSMNNMKMILLAMHNYHDANGAFPDNVRDEEGNALLSWRVRLLPYLEEQALYDQFRLDEPWDSEHNRPLADRMPLVFASSEAEPRNATRYRGFEGEGCAFGSEEPLSFRQIADGTSNTLMIVQAAPQAAVIWTQPGDLQFNPERPFAGVRSPDRAATFLAGFADGSVRKLPFEMGEEVMRALVSIDGGEFVPQEIWR